MKGSDYLVLIGTFLIGVVAGGYVYVTAYAPATAERQQQQAARHSEVYGEATGGCERAQQCGELFVASDRTYRYSSDGSEMETGTISRSLRNELSAALVDYQENGGGAVPGECNGFVDGIDYEYDISAYGEQYSVATCGDGFGTSEVAAVLEEVWQVAITGTATEGRPVILEKGLAGWLTEQLDRQFDYDEQ